MCIIYLIDLDDGKIYRKPLYLVKTMVSCRFSLKPIHWISWSPCCGIAGYFSWPSHGGFSLLALARQEAAARWTPKWRNDRRVGLRTLLDWGMDGGWMGMMGMGWSMWFFQKAHWCGKFWGIRSLGRSKARDFEKCRRWPWKRRLSAEDWWTFPMAFPMAFVCHRGHD